LRNAVLEQRNTILDFKLYPRCECCTLSLDDSQAYEIYVLMFRNADPKRRHGKLKTSGNHPKERIQQRHRSPTRWTGYGSPWMEWLKYYSS